VFAHVNASQSRHGEWSPTPPSQHRVAVSLLFGLWAGAVTAVAINVYRPGMLVLLALTTIALLVIGVRSGSLSDMSLGSRPAGSQAPPPPSSVADEIAKLAELQKAGLISKAEFAAQKAKLLEL
jgi:hypothetical protein